MAASKLNPRIYFFIFLVLALMTLGFYILLHSGTSYRNRLGGHNTGTLPGVILVIGMALILFWILRSIDWMSIDTDQIRILTKLSRHTLTRSDIRSIRLWDAKGHISDGIAIDTIGDDTYWLGDGVWRNGAEMKRALMEQYAELIPRPAKTHPGNPPQGNPPIDERPLRTASASPEPEQTVTFSGYFLLSQNGILLIGTIAGLIWGTNAIATSDRPPAWVYVLPTIPAVTIIAYLSSQLFYFRIGPESLEIRNYVLIWYRKEFLFTDIDSANIGDGEARNSRTLCVKTIDFETHYYPAGSLRTKDWRALADAMKKMNIPTRSDL